MVFPRFSHVFPTFLDATVSVGLFVFNPQEAIQETWQRRFDRAEAGIAAIWILGLLLLVGGDWNRGIFLVNLHG